MSYYKNRFRKSVPNHDIVDIAAGHPTVRANPPQIVVSAAVRSAPQLFRAPGYHEIATHAAVSSRLREAAVRRKIAASKK